MNEQIALTSFNQIFPHHQDEQLGGHDTRSPSLRKQENMTFPPFPRLPRQKGWLTRNLVLRALQSTAPVRKGKAGPHLLRGPTPGPPFPEQPLQLSSGRWQAHASSTQGGAGPRGVCGPHLTLRRQSRHEDRTPAILVWLCLFWEGWWGGQGSSEEVWDSREGSAYRVAPTRAQVTGVQPVGQWRHVKEGDGSRRLPGAHLVTERVRVRKWRSTRQSAEHLQRQQQREWRSGEWHPSKSKPAPWTRWASPPPATRWHRLVRRSSWPEVEEARLTVGPPQERGFSGLNPAPREGLLRAKSRPRRGASQG